MRTSGLQRCAPGFPLIRWCGNVFRPRRPVHPWRTGRPGRDASDPPVRGPGTGSGPGVLAHPPPPPSWVASVPSVPAGRPSAAPVSAVAQTALAVSPARLQARRCWPHPTHGDLGLDSAIRVCHYTTPAVRASPLRCMETAVASRRRHGEERVAMITQRCLGLAQVGLARAAA